MFLRCGWLSLCVVCIVGSSPPAWADSDPEPTLAIESSGWEDSNGLRVREMAMTVETPLTSAWRVAWLAKRVRSEAEFGANGGAAVGLRLVANDDTDWLRSIELRRNSFSRYSVEGGFTLATGAWTLDWQREVLPAQRDLVQHGPKLNVDFTVGPLSLQGHCSQSRVSDGNHVRHCEATVVTQEPEEGSWFLQPQWVAQRRIARFWSPYYWSPERAESNAGPGIAWVWRIGEGSRVRAGLWRLLPLNDASSSTLRQSLEIELPVPKDLHTTVSVMRLRGVGGERPYRGTSVGLSISPARW